MLATAMTSRSTSSSSRRDDHAPQPRQAGDADLIQACLDGEAAAWEELVRRYERLVYSIPRRYGLDRQLSEDVFQEVFAILLRRLAGIRNRAGLPKWLITTTHRMCRQVARRAGPTGVGHPEMIDVDAPPDAESLRWEKQQLVRSSLRRLGGRCEQLLTLMYMAPGQVSYEAIADQLDMPLGSIGPTRARCLAKLMAILRDADEERSL